MKIIKTANKITFELLNKKKIGFIPTMGCLHDGHVSLIKKSKKKKLLTIVSIFVNPYQFNNKKDYKKYPKTILTDLKICKKNKVDYVYLPEEKDIYPEKKIIIKNKIHHFKKHKRRRRQKKIQTLWHWQKKSALIICQSRSISFLEIHFLDFLFNNEHSF
jgi:pantoate--beta-alanine ligase